ncbi:unnamed protein product [Closterium sp. Yama58-4]|nr:unnamed protein product [Closterium sp. Yama58-4]
MPPKGGGGARGRGRAAAGGGSGGRGGGRAGGRAAQGKAPGFTGKQSVPTPSGTGGKTDASKRVGVGAPSGISSAGPTRVEGGGNAKPVTLIGGGLGKNAFERATEVRLSSEAEEQLRMLVVKAYDTKKGANGSNALDAPPASSSYSTDSAAGPMTLLEEKTANRRILSAYETLSREGFTVEQVESALSSLVPSSLSLEAAFDWLCLHLPPQQLPRHFASAASTATLARGDVEVVLAAADVEGEGQRGSDDAWGREGDEEGGKRRRRKDLRKKASADQRMQSLAADLGRAKAEAARAKGSMDKGRQAEAGLVIREIKEEAAGYGMACVCCVTFKMLRAKGSMDKGRQAEGYMGKGSQAEAGMLIREIKEEAAGYGVCVAATSVMSTKGCMVKGRQAEAGMLIREIKDEAAAYGEQRLGCCEIKEEAAGYGYSESMLEEANQQQQRVAAEEDEETEEEEGGFGLFGEDDEEEETPLERGGKSASGERAGAGAGATGKAAEKEGEEEDMGLEGMSLFDDESDGGGGGEGGKGAAAALPESVLALQRKRGRLRAGKRLARVTMFLVPLYISLFPIFPLPGPAVVRRREAQSRELQQRWRQWQALAVGGAVGTGGTGGTGGTKSNDMKESREAREASERRAMQEMKRKRGELPMAAVREELLRALREGDVVVVSGETGSGKTTQVPQYIFEDAEASGKAGFCNIVCTQPRRIAAISVAERVAAERCEPPVGSGGRGGGGGGAGVVGYHVRLDAVKTWYTRILFCTTGILLRRLVGDPLLSDVTHVVVDEVHERSIQGDFLLVILRDLLARRQEMRRQMPHLPSFKLVLMSATLDASLFASYFSGCPVIQAQGRTFPVEMKYLEDVYESTGYKLSSDSPAALRSESHQSAKVQFKSRARGSKAAAGGGSKTKQKLLKAGWGDDASLQAETVNPDYDASRYSDYSDRTRTNLRRLDEGTIDYELLEDVVAHIDSTCSPGAILVFLPGMGEIQYLWDRLAASRQFGAPGKVEWLLPLHSSVSAAEQRQAFNSPPIESPRLSHPGMVAWLLPLHSSVSAAKQRAAFNSRPSGVPKVSCAVLWVDSRVYVVVLATKIAETSITIDDVVYVVDVWCCAASYASYAHTVVLATNIAETSITIDDVVYVVDVGKQKETQFDARRLHASITGSITIDDVVCAVDVGKQKETQFDARRQKETQFDATTGMTSLVEAWVAKANVRQRAGRAGRVQAGRYFALFTRHRFETIMRPFQQPEIQRVPLVELCLQIKLLDLGTPAHFLSKAIEPPKEEAVRSAMKTLREVGAVDEREELTALGTHLAALPVDVRIGKMMIYGAVMGCLSTALTIAACLSYRSPFSSSFHDRKAAARARQALVAKAREADPDATSREAGGKQGEESWDDEDSEDEDEDEGWESQAEKESAGGKGGKGAGEAGGKGERGAGVSGDDRAWNMARGQQSDHLAMASAYNGWVLALQVRLVVLRVGFF